MIFIVITFLTALLIEGLGTFVSVLGLSALFGYNPIIIALAVALDLGKLIVVSLLYTYWDKLGKIMKTYAFMAAVITMTITSAGAAGYLSGEFQKAIIGTQEVSLKVDLLKQEQERLLARKQQIDQQIATLPERFTANQRIRMISQFRAEQAQVTTRLAEIDRELPTLKIDQINVEAKAGPILYIAKAFNISVEQAAKWVILMIIFVFDPLAVFLVIAGNFLLHQRRLQKMTPVSAADLFTEKPAEPAVRPATSDEVAAFKPLTEQSTTPPIFEALRPTSQLKAYQDEGPVAKTFEEIGDSDIKPPRDDDTAPSENVIGSPSFTEPQELPGGIEPIKQDGPITLSSLGLVPEDPTTVTDANGSSVSRFRNHYKK
jgi:hypothetical protein